MIAEEKMVADEAFLGLSFLILGLTQKQPLYG
jgi:hypothetical protein